MAAVGVIAGGFIPLSDDYMEYLKMGLRFGTLNGLAVGVGVAITIHRDSILACVIASVVAVQIAVAIAQYYFFLSGFPGFRGASAGDAFVNIFGYYLMASIIFFIPTVAISSIVVGVIRNRYPRVPRLS